MSDEWRAFNDAERLVDSNGEVMKYKHHTVNYKVGFINFDNHRVHTQTFERYCGDMEEVMKRRGVSKTIEQHLCRYKFLKKYSVNTLHHLMVEQGNHSLILGI